VLVGNKVDLLPKGAPEARLKAWLRKEALEYGLVRVSCLFSLFAKETHAMVL